jgi:hypothetical protein
MYSGIPMTPIAINEAIARAKSLILVVLVKYVCRSVFLSNLFNCASEEKSRCGS